MSASARAVPRTPSPAPSGRPAGGRSRTGARSAPRRPARGTRSTAQLRAVPDATRTEGAARPRSQKAGRGVFTLVMCGVLAAGLVGLLVVNTSLAQGAFALDGLSIRMTALSEREQALQQELAMLSTPRRLEEQARALGMVHAPNPVFLRLSDGRVLGTPVPAPYPYIPPAPDSAAGGPDALEAAGATSTAATTDGATTDGAVTTDGLTTMDGAATGGAAVPAEAGAGTDATVLDPTASDGTTVPRDLVAPGAGAVTGIPDGGAAPVPDPGYEANATVAEAGDEGPAVEAGR